MATNNSSSYAIFKNFDTAAGAGHEVFHNAIRISAHEWSVELRVQ